MFEPFYVGNYKGIVLNYFPVQERYSAYPYMLGLTDAAMKGLYENLEKYGITAANIKEYGIHLWSKPYYNNVEDKWQFKQTVERIEKLTPKSIRRLHGILGAIGRGQKKCNYI